MSDPDDMTRPSGERGPAPDDRKADRHAASDFPPPLVVHRRHWSLSLVWLVPLIAVTMAGWVLVHELLERGPTVSIRFKTAEGLEAGRTRLKYKDVDIGTVTGIELDEDITGVLVTAQLSKRSRPFLVEDTRFWVVRPRIAAGAISGLGTLLSGAYIGVDIGKSGTARDHFQGLETPPVVTTGLPGRQFILQAEEAGSIDIGAPVYYRHIKVGQVIAYDLDSDGRGVTLRAFVNAPYDRFVTDRSRFWEASGLDIALDASGVKVGIESLASLVSGGIAFQSPPESPAGAPAAAEARFTLSPNRTAAMKQPDIESVTYVLYFPESLRGLSRGAPVNFHGIEVGEVESIDVEYDRQERILRFPVRITVYPERMRSRQRREKGLPPGGAWVSRQLLDQLVMQGLRAQLKAGNLLTGQLFISLDFMTEAVPARMDWSRSPAVIPTVRGNLDELQSTLARVARRIDKVPFDTIAADLQRTLASLENTLQGTDRLLDQLGSDLAPDLRTTLESARATLAGVRQALSPQAPLQLDARETLDELTRAARSLRTLTDYLERHPESLLRGRRPDAPPDPGATP